MSRSPRRKICMARSTSCGANYLYDPAATKSPASTMVTAYGLMYFRNTALTWSGVRLCTFASIAAFHIMVRPNSLRANSYATNA